MYEFGKYEQFTLSCITIFFMEKYSTIGKNYSKIKTLVLTPPDVFKIFVTDKKILGLYIQ